MPIVDCSTFLATTFDYLIIGGGTAGLVLAARLSENPEIIVGVIEAGYHKPDDLEIKVPGMAGRALMNPGYDWQFFTVPQPEANGRIVVQPRGKVLGGSTAINFLAVSRAPAEEYDSIENFGNPGWNWESFLYYMKKSETFALPDSEYDKYNIKIDPGVHGTTGPVATSLPIFVPDLHMPFTESLAALGVDSNPEPNNGRSAGATFTKSSVERKTATRSTAATAYFEPNRDRRNFLVLTGAHVTKIDFEPTSPYSMKASDVHFVCNGEKHDVGARREVILSAGAIQTPQLLELSGIGKKEVLTKYDIEQVIELPGVGENLRKFQMLDHPYVTSVFEVTPNHITGDLVRDPLFHAEQLKLYEEKQQGYYSSAQCDFVYIPLRSVVQEDKVEALKTQFDNFKTSAPTRLEKQYNLQCAWLDSAVHPQLELIHNPSMLYGAGVPVQDFRYQTIIAVLLHPLSRGSVHIASSDPFDKPAIDPAYIRNPLDLEILKEGVKFARKVTTTEPLRASTLGSTNPDASVQTDEDFREYCRNSVQGLYHSLGTAAMLPRESGGVVDHNLRVYGTTNLRIVDASILPIQLGCHLQATVYAIAEKAADIIKDSTI